MDISEEQSIRNQQLIECYLSGQMEEWAWQEHLEIEPGLGDMYSGVERDS